MGAPIKQRKKYVSHKKRWDKQTIVDEESLTNDYALKNKREVRKIELVLSRYKKIAKIMNSNSEKKSSIEAKNFIEKLKKLGFLNVDSTSLDEVLDIKVRNILERRLSNIVYKQKLAKTPTQARQFVVHGHIKVGSKVVTAPSHLVSLPLESTVEFNNYSNLADENHPERKISQEEGMEAEIEKLEETPLKTEHEGDSDKVETALDEEEQDEVKE